MECTYSLEDFEALKQSYQKASISIEQLTEKNLHLQKELETALKKVNWFEEQIKLAKMRAYGKKSETNLQQLHLPVSMMFDTPEGEKQYIEATSTPQSKEVETITYTRQKSEGRRIDTSKLPRERIVHDLAPEDKYCTCCGKEMEKFGEDVSEQLEYVPAKIKVIEHVCPKYTCRSCNIVNAASKPELPVAKCMAAPSLIANVIINKYANHLPLYRQSKMLLQESIDIPPNTLGNWVMQSGRTLLPLGEALWEQIKLVKNLQVDETPVELLEKKGKGYMWCYHSLQENNRFIVFEYCNTRGQENVNKRLEKYQGILQNDGYAGYNKVRAQEGIVAIGCFAHCRRHFAEVLKIGASGKAAEAVAYIGKLYGIEQEAREQALSYEQRKDLRQEKAKPVLQEFEAWLTQTKQQVPPQSAIGKAINYAVNQWPYLQEYINHGEAEIDNNLVENQIRPFALGRRNWLFIGNEGAAEIAALLYSLIQTAKINNIHPQRYLIYVLKQTGKMRRGEIDPTKVLPQFVDRHLLDSS
jgi:transposase